MIPRAFMFLAIVAAAGSTASAQFGAGNLVVVQVGDGSAALASSATVASLLEFTTAGSAVGGPLGLPTVGSGSNRRLTLSGTATSEGFLQRSADGNFLTIAGYDASVGTASITGAQGSAVARVVGRVDMNMVIDTSTALTEAVNPGNARSVVSSNGTDFWMATSAGGVRYLTLGGVASTQLSTSPTNTRVAEVFGGQLYMSASSGAFQGVSTVGTGLQTTSGQTTTLLTGFPTTTGPSAYDFVFANASTLYVADDRTNANGGGIQKWVESGGTWSLAYTLAVGTTGARGLTGALDGTGAFVLYATTTESNANRLVSVVDNGVGSAFSLLATAPANTAFRGVEFAPIPSPGTLALLGLSGLIAARRRR